MEGYRRWSATGMGSPDRAVPPPQGWLLTCICGKLSQAMERDRITPVISPNLRSPLPHPYILSVFFAE